MKISHEECRSAPRRSRTRFSIFGFPFSIFVLAPLLGCGAPGEPVPKRPPVPAAVTDLAARQAGDAVVLTFTLPRTTIDGHALEEPPAVEIYRGSLPAGGAPGKLTTRLVYTIPSAVVDTYLSEARVRFVDPLRPEDVSAQAGAQMVYMVRTRASKRRASADSNAVSVRVYPAPARITDLTAAVTEKAIELRWTPPERSSSGAPLGSLAGYRVFRAEVEPGPEAAASQDPSKAKLKVPLELLAPTSASEFSDTQFEFGRTYLYTVRSVAQFQSDSVESTDSLPVVVSPRDVFPPAAPKDLVAILVPATPAAPAHVELSWGISTETDLAGYYVYRHEGGGPETPVGSRISPNLLPSPAFRDMSVTAGRRYTYQVTAVDRAGNESSPSTAASVEVAQNEP